MKRHTIIGILVFLSILVGAYAVIDGAPLSSPSGNPGATLTVTFTINNTEAFNFTNVNFSATNLEGPQKYTISAPSISNFTTTIANGLKANHSFTVAIPSGTSSVLAGAYNGNVSLTGSNGTSFVGSKFLYTINVNSIPGITIDTFSNSNPLVLSAEEGQSVSSTVTFRNTGSTNLTNVQITHNVNSGDNDGDNVTIEITPQNFSLSPGNSRAVTFKATMDNDLDIGTYDGTVFVNDTTSGTNLTFALEAKVTPEVCKEGIVGKLTLDINDPDDGDDFEFGDTIHLDVDVRNNHDKDLDIVVEAFLYNIDEDDELVRGETDAKEIKDGDEEGFTLDLEIPTSSNFDESDEYIIFVKAFEDGDEDDNCDQQEIDIDLERKNHEVTVDRFTITPSSLACGESISVLVDIENAGKKDEDDVTVRLLQSTLGLDLKSEKFDLENFDESDNDATARFTFAIPTTVSVGTYPIEAIVNFDGGKQTNSDFEDVIIASCNGETLTATVATTSTSTSSGVSADLNLVSSSSGEISGSEGSKTTFTVDGVNTHTVTFGLIGTQSATLTVASTPSTFTLDVGDSRSIDLNSDGRDDARFTLNTVIAGVATVKVERLSGASFLSTTSGDFIPVGIWSQIWSTLSKPSTIFWIIVDLILLVVAIFLIKVLFTKPKK